MTKQIFLMTTEGEIRKTFVPDSYITHLVYKVSGYPFELKFKLVENLRLKGCELFFEIPQSCFEQP